MGMPHCYHGVLGWARGGCSRCHERELAEDGVSSIDSWFVTREDVKVATNRCVEKGLLSPERLITWDSFELAVQDWRDQSRRWWDRNGHDFDIGGEG